MKVRPINMKRYCRRKTQPRQYKNLIEALNLSNIIRKIIGISIFVLKIQPGNRVIRKLSLFGLSSFLIWYAFYLYCTYIAHAEDQTVLRILYNTKVQRYGDDYERISSAAYVMFSLWKIPFKLNTQTYFMETMVSVDNYLKGLGENIDYTKDAHLALNLSICQMITYLLRVISIWTTLTRLNVVIPAERLYQVTFSNSIAFVLTAHYCFFLKVLTDRYKHINKVLDDIKSHKSWEYKLFTRGRMLGNVQKPIGLQDKYICEKIKTSAKIYGMLYKVCDSNNRMFGGILMLTIFVSMSYIILYMFYFMEATAAGLFHDVEKYIVFLIYVGWQIAYGVGIIFLIVFVSERAVYAAQTTSFILHEIMNSDFSPAVNVEAMQLSIQTLHQKPIFTALGLYELDYRLLYQLARAVCTYLIILLQFVTDAKQTDSIDYYDKNV